MLEGRGGGGRWEGEGGGEEDAGGSELVGGEVVRGRWRHRGGPDRSMALARCLVFIVAAVQWKVWESVFLE